MHVQRGVRFALSIGILIQKMSERTRKSLSAWAGKHSLRAAFTA
jgi:hypothetical protein